MGEFRGAGAILPASNQDRTVSERALPAAEDVAADLLRRPRRLAGRRIPDLIRAELWIVEIVVERAVVLAELTDRAFVETPIQHLSGVKDDRVGADDFERVLDHRTP
jgi:hypothetical protein